MVMSPSTTMLSLSVATIALVMNLPQRTMKCILIGVQVFFKINHSSTMSSDTSGARKLVDQKLAYHGNEIKLFEVLLLLFDRLQAAGEVSVLYQSFFSLFHEP